MSIDDSESMLESEFLSQPVRQWYLVRIPRFMKHIQ